MESLLDELYSCCSSRRRARVPEQEAILKKYFEMTESIQQTYGVEFADQLAEASEQRFGYSGAERFREGFCAGVRLMLEVLTPV